MFKSLFEHILGTKLYPNRRGEAKTRCPCHDDHHTSLRVDILKGVLWCPVCGVRGELCNLGELLKKGLSQ